MKNLLFAVIAVVSAEVVVCQVGGDDIADQADSHIGETTWAFASYYSVRFPWNTWKCNLFIADVMRELGADVPHRRWWIYSPIGADEWANPDSTYLTNDPCWTRVTSPQPGDVAGHGTHVGFVTESQQTTSAAEHGVIKNDWGFRSGQNTVFWRYSC